MIPSLKSVAGGLAVCVLFAGCGSGLEPISVLGDPSQSLVGTIALPIASNVFNTVAPFSSSNDGFDYSYTLGRLPTVTATSVVYSAPANGWVTAIDSSSGFPIITLFHNSHLSTRIKIFTTTNVRVGDFVTAGQALGTLTLNLLTATSLLHLSVIADGAVVCPYSYLNTAARTDSNTIFAQVTGTTSNAISLVQSPCGS